MIFILTRTLATSKGQTNTFKNSIDVIYEQHGMYNTIGKRIMKPCINPPHCRHPKGPEGDQATRRSYITNLLETHNNQLKPLYKRKNRIQKN